MHKITKYETVLRKRGTLRVAESTVDGPQAAARVAHAAIGDRACEVFIAIALDSHMSVRGFTEIATAGSATFATLDAHAVARFAVLSNATAIVIAHNHPSGNHRPSDEDRAVTRHARATLEAIGVTLVDHVIVTPNGAWGQA